MDDQLDKYPTPELRDHVRTGVTAGVAAIPYVGGSVQILADAVIVPSLTKRRDRWLTKLGEVVNELQERDPDFDPSSLAGDEAFVTAVADASRIAMGTHLEAKLDLLKNCLVSMAVESERDEFMDLQMFRFVDDLTPEHFTVLQYLASPGAWFDAKGLTRPNLSMGSPSSLMRQAQLPVSGAALDIVLRDLNDRGLVDTGSLGTTMTGTGVWADRITPLGSELLAFVRNI